LFKQKETVEAQALEQGRIHAEREHLFLKREAQECEERLKQSAPPVPPIPISSSIPPVSQPQGSAGPSVPIKQSSSNQTQIPPSASHILWPQFNNPNGLPIGRATEWKDQMAYQQMKHRAFQEGEPETICDQGICFDGQSIPHDLELEPDFKEQLWKSMRDRNDDSKSKKSSKKSNVD
jgi:hypothetical protein